MTRRRIYMIDDDVVIVVVCRVCVFGKKQKTHTKQQQQ
jgi:hypothetical protein